MANQTPSVNGSDPAIQRQVDRETSSLLSSSQTLGLAPIVNGAETVYPQSTAVTSTNSVTITSSVNNDTGDITTVYNSGSRITVNPINQTVNQYTAVDSGVSSIVAGNGIIISSTGGNGKGTVTINSATGNVGNIASINLDGNVANVLHGDGSWSADVTDYSNSNVISLLSAFGSNVITTTGLITGDGGGLSNIAGGSNTQIQINNEGALSGSANLFWDSTFETLYTPKISIANAINSTATQIGITPGALANGQGPTWTFDSGGGLYWPASGGAIWVIEPNTDGEFEFKSTSNIVISTDISNANSHFTFDTDGIFTAPSNVNLLGSRLNVGPDAATAANLLNPTLVIANTGAQYIQAAIINNDGSGSSDWSADGAGGGDDEAWTDMGFAGHSFSDANYTITNPGDGYLFVQAYANGVGGNMVLATGENGNSADIVFATGGFLSSNEFARIDHTNNVFHLTRTGSGIKFQDGTTQTTAFTGGLGNIVSINLDGNVSNVLRGDGTWGADANSSYGDSNVTTLLGAFGSNAITTTGIITADGYGLSNVPYANITGTPTLGNIASINIDGNASNVLLGSGSFGAVPGLGNIASINLDGNVSNVLAGNGTFVALPVIDANTVVWSTAPVSNTSTGNAGQAAYDSGGNLYICVAANTWAKFTGTTSW